MSKIVLATGNKGKVRELSTLLAPFNLEIIAQSELNVMEAEETGTTFVENAIIKARNAAKQTGLPAIADDSGLSVDYLTGAPGVYSSRYAGENASDSTNITKLLEALKDTPEEQRTAAFHCVLVYMKNAEDATPVICHGKWRGRITNEPQGSDGFGYDPVFFVEEFACTAAELSAEQKNQLSHRGKALKELAKALAPAPI